MTFRILPPHLHATAESARAHYASGWGIARARLRVEQPIADEAKYVTTFSAQTREHNWLCVDVSTRVYSPSLDAFVLQCKNDGIPAKLFVAVPESGIEGDFQSDLRTARANGIGLLEVRGSRVTVMQEALCLLLTGVRQINLQDFPMKYRQPLSGAVSTFRGGNPAKGCADLYDEIEQLTRRIAIKALQKGQWRDLPAGQVVPKLRAETDPWARVCRTLIDHYDQAKSGTPGLTDALLARVLGITSHRNDTGHKPSNYNELRTRNLKLRTRFEAGVDLLIELIDAGRPFRA